AEDHHGVAGVNASGVQDGSGPGYDPAAEQRRLSERQCGGYDRELVFVDQCPFGETAEAESLEQTKPVAAQARGVARSAQRRLGMPALKRASGEASLARSARLRKRTDDVISHTDWHYVGTDGSHDASDLVTQHRR